MATKMNMADARERLICDGASSYLAAFYDVAEFQRLILKICRDAVHVRLSDLANAAGVSLQLKDLKDYVKPKNTLLEKGDYSYAWLGVELRVKKCTLYSGLYWNSEKQIPGSLLVMSDLAFADDLTCDRALERLDKSELPKKFWESELSFCEPIQPKDAILLEDKLPVVIGQWVKALKTAGGLQALLRV
jgi:hypothetical protein